MDERHERPASPAVRNCVSGPVRSSARASTPPLATRSLSAIWHNLRKSTPTQSYGVTSKRPGRRVPRSAKRRREPAPRAAGLYPHRATVHQGDLDPVKRRLPHQRRRRRSPVRGVCTVEKISEAYLLPALEQLLDTFPFQVLGFHSDNGSEYINRTVAALLEKTADPSFTNVAFAAVQRQCPGGKQERRGGSKTVRLQPYPAALRTAHQRPQPAVSQPLHQFPPPLFLPPRPAPTDSQGKQRKVYRYGDHDDALMTSSNHCPRPEDYLKPGVRFDTSTPSPTRSATTRRRTVSRRPARHSSEPFRDGH